MDDNSPQTVLYSLGPGNPASSVIGRGPELPTKEAPALVLRERKPKGSCCIPTTPKHTQTHTHTHRFLQALTHAHTHTQRHSGQGSGWGQAEPGGCRCEASGSLFLGRGSG